MNYLAELAEVQRWLNLKKNLLWLYLQKDVPNHYSAELGSVAGPVIQANVRLKFEDDLRSGGLLCFISMNASVRTELADSMVTPGEPGGD